MYIDISEIKLKKRIKNIPTKLKENSVFFVSLGLTWTCSRLFYFLFLFKRFLQKMGKNYSWNKTKVETLLAYKEPCPFLFVFCQENYFASKNNSLKRVYEFTEVFPVLFSNSCHKFYRYIDA